MVGLTLVLGGCFEQNKETENGLLSDSVRIQKSDFSIVLPSTWQEIHPSTITDVDFRTKDVRALFQQKEEDFRGSRAYLVLTTQKVETGATALEFFSESRDNMPALWFGFIVENEEEIEISSQNTILLTFTVQKQPDSVPVSYWQTYLVKNNTGYVFTAGKSEPVTQESGQTILNIFRSIVLL